MKLALREIRQPSTLLSIGNTISLVSLVCQQWGLTVSGLAFGGILKLKSVYPDKSLLKVQMFFSEGKLKLNARQRALACLNDDLVRPLTQMPRVSCCAF